MGSLVVRLLSFVGVYVYFHWDQMKWLAGVPGVIAIALRMLWRNRHDIFTVRKPPYEQGVE
jgi:hypothetical protein